MRIFSASFKVLTCAIFFAALSAVAQAQATRTWVSGVGDDVNPCSRTAPCKTYAAAIAKTATNGEISTLDPGGYGSVTITKSITIEGTAGQGYGSIIHGGSPTGTNGVTIAFDMFSASSPPETNKTVRLRNLNINGNAGMTGNPGSGLRSIRILGGTMVTNTEVFVEDCVLDGSQGNPGRGIEDTRSGGGKLIVTNTTVRNMAGTGIVVIPASGANRIDAIIDNVRVHNCGFGIVVSSGGRMVVTNSVVSANTNHAFSAEGPSGASELLIDNCRIINNATGIRQDAGGTVRVANSTVAYNTANGTVGTVNSFSNNRFVGNAGSSAVVAIGAQSHDTGQQ
jgi:hypothetical protein